MIAVCLLAALAFVFGFVAGVVVGQAQPPRGKSGW